MSASEIDGVMQALIDLSDESLTTLAEKFLEIQKKGLAPAESLRETWKATYARENVPSKRMMLLKVIDKVFRFAMVEGEGKKAIGFWKDGLIWAFKSFQGDVEVVASLIREWSSAGIVPTKICEKYLSILKTSEKDSKTLCEELEALESSLGREIDASMVTNMESILTKVKNKIHPKKHPTPSKFEANLHTLISAIDKDQQDSVEDFLSADKLKIMQQNLRRITDSPATPKQATPVSSSKRKSGLFEKQVTTETVSVDLDEMVTLLKSQMKANKMRMERSEKQMNDLCSLLELSESASEAFEKEYSAFEIDYQKVWKLKDEHERRKRMKDEEEEESVNQELLQERLRASKLSMDSSRRTLEEIHRRIA